MCTKAQCIELLRRVSPYLRNEFGVRSLCLFGSMARGDSHIGSDVDVYVDMPPKAFKIIALKNYLQDLLGVAVDVIRKRSDLDKLLVSEIERDGITIFA